MNTHVICFLKNVLNECNKLIIVVLVSRKFMLSS